MAVVAVGLLLMAIMGLWVYMSATATPLHPNAQDVPSVTQAAPLPRWADAVEQGRQIARAGLSEQNLPGLSVAVGVGGDIVWAEGFGWADLDTRVPVAPETRFRIGTASIALTSAAVGLLVEKGQLKLDDEIQTYVPEFPKKQWPVTLRQLMGHVAGVRNDSGDEGPLLSEHCERPVDALQHFAEELAAVPAGNPVPLFELRLDPGERGRRSRRARAVPGRSCGSRSSSRWAWPTREPTRRPSRSPNRATPYFPRFAGDPRYGLDLMREIDYSCYAGSSAFLSTPSDLVRFGMAINGGTLLQPATVQLLQTSQRLPSGEETGYGLGWDLETVALAGEQTRTVGHDGESLGGMAVSLMTFPEHGIVVAVTSNTSYADTFALGLKIAQAFAEQEAVRHRRLERRVGR